MPNISLIFYQICIVFASPKNKVIIQTLFPGIKIMCRYPLGHGDKSLVNEPIFAKLAEKYGKTPAQIILKWHNQMGFIVIPGSRNPEHIKENADIFDFKLTVKQIHIRIMHLNGHFYALLVLKYD